MIKQLFHAIELFAFVLPAIPEAITTRLSIVATYYAAYYFELPCAYKRLKDICVKLEQELELEELTEERFIIQETDKTA